MNILFIHPKYHTNHDPRVKALSQGGHSVKHIQMWEPKQSITDQTVEPTVLYRSFVSELVERLVQRLSDLRVKEFQWSPVYDLWNEMQSFDPDVVIVRDYYVNSALALLFAEMLDAGGMVQEQSPMYEGYLNCKYSERFTEKKSLFHELYSKVFDKDLIRITPVRGYDTGSTVPDRVYYVPFTADLEQYANFERKDHLRNDTVNIISVATLHSKRKNHIGLLKSFDELHSRYDISLMIIGALSDEADENYRRIVSYIEDNDLESEISIETNLQYEEVQKQYSSYDLFVLPSEREPAAVSPLEAMAAGLPVICSDTNGTQDYITEGETGYVFRTGSQWDLTHKLEAAIEDRTALKSMGQRAYDDVRETYPPAVYRRRMEEIITENFDSHA